MTPKSKTLKLVGTKLAVTRNVDGGWNSAQSIQHLANLMQEVATTDEDQARIKEILRAMRPDDGTLETWLQNVQTWLGNLCPKATQEDGYIPQV